MLQRLKPNKKNLYLCQWEFSQGTSLVVSTPPTLQLARSNICNFKCVYCDDHRAGNTLPRTKIVGADWDRLAALIPQSDLLSFHGVSEFMVDPEFFTILAQSADAESGLALNTNGSVCTERHVQALADYPATLMINFSLDAASALTYLRIRGNDFWRTIGNIKTYVERLKSRKIETYLAASFVVTKSNVHEMTEFLYMAKALGLHGVRYLRLHEYPGLDWEVPTKHGGKFNYQEEYVIHAAEVYNQQVQQVARAAELFNFIVELPAAFTEAELKERRA